MKIKVLGGSGSEGPGFNLTGFLINDHVVLDAGTISAALSEDEQAISTRHPVPCPFSTISKPFRS